MKCELYLNSDGYQNIDSRVAYVEMRSSDEARVYLYEGTSTYGRTCVAVIKECSDIGDLIARIYPEFSISPICGIDYNGTIYSEYNYNGSGIGKIVGNRVHSDTYDNYHNIVGCIDDDGVPLWVAYGALATLWLVISKMNMNSGPNRQSSNQKNTSDVDWNNIEKNRKTDPSGPVINGIATFIAAFIVGALVSGVVLLIFSGFVLAPLFNVTGDFILYVMPIVGLIVAIGIMPETYESYYNSDERILWERLHGKKLTPPSQLGNSKKRRRNGKRR